MKKFTVITAFNDNPTYKTFVGPAIKMWNKFGYDIKIAYIMDNETEDHGIENLNEMAEIIPFKRIEGVDSGVQSKVSRMWLASKQKDFLITDVDLFVLNIKYMEDNWFSKYNETNILAIGGDHYAYKEEDEGKWPMYYTTGSGELLSKIINLNNLEYEDWVLSNKGTKPIYDKKEDTGNPFPKFSDESLLRRLTFQSEYNNQVLRINRIKSLTPVNNLMTWSLEHYRRIDRTWAWTYNKEKLYDGWYIDCFPKRPLKKKDPVIKEVFKYLDL